MDDKVLTDDEVGALLEGVESGEIEVQTAAGPRYASVATFEVPRRSRLVSKSFPKLELLNDKFADRLKVQTQRITQGELGLTCRQTVETPFDEIGDQHRSPLVAIQFAARPLQGHGALIFEAELVNQLVELYFGGSASEPNSPKVNGFTLGELRVTHAYAKLVLATLKDVWEPVQAIEPEQIKTESSISLLGIAEETDPVIKSTFDFSFAEHDAAMYLLAPNAMLEPLLPFFKGIDRKKDLAQDKVWGDTIRDGLTDVAVALSTNVGQATMTLGELICLEPGDVIDISDPRHATISAESVPLLAGRFGVHCGQNAVEATRWLGDEH